MTTSQKLMGLIVDMEVPPTLNSLKRDTKENLDLNRTIITVSGNSLHTTSLMGNLNFTKPKLPPLPILQQKENPITFIEKFKNRFAGLTEQEGIALFPEFLEGPALIDYKAIETEKMVTLDGVLKE
uniref:Reverse transcriptase domain-containing protein n=1 Tax=Strongyloides papillosus TaxID=174720 RepID=A0A0N5C9M5_STREA